jgi:hypothetical protein
MNKCLCPTPDYISVPIEHGMTETYLLKGFGTVLHGKKADRECYRCGVDLCGDCMLLDAWEDWYDPWGRVVWKNPGEVRFLCPACEGYV